jgi:hypothetical protein
MVIDGGREGVGSEPDKIAPLLRAAARRTDTGPELALARRGGMLHIHVGTARPAAGAATLWLVGFDREHETKVLRGENQGETAHDYHIVRSFAAVGVWDGKALDLNVPATTASGDDAALLLQIGGTGPIVAAATLTGPSS